MIVPVKSDESVDDLLHGQLKLIQKRKGFRYSVDALLLSHFVLPAEGERAIDLGTGSGVIPLILAARGRAEKLVGVEIQPALADMARRSVKLNGFDQRINIIESDLLDLGLPDGSFDLVLSNPPFQPRGSGRVSPHPEKAVARHEVAITLKELLLKAKRLITPQGRICLVFPMDQRIRLESEVQKAELYPARIQIAYASPHQDPRLLLIELRKTDPGKVKTLSGIAIQTDQGKFSLDGYR